MSSFDLSGYLLVGKNSSNQNTGGTNALLSNEDLINKLIQDKQNILMVEENEKFLKAEAVRRGISGGDLPSFDYMPFIIILLVSLVICIFVIALGNAFPFIPSSVITLLCLIVIAVGAMLSFREYTYYAAYYADATIRMNQNYLDKTNANQCVGPVCCSDASGTVWDPIKSICVVKPSAVSSSNAMPISSAYNPQQSYAGGRRDANQLLSLFNGQLNSGSNYIPGGNQPLPDQQTNAQSTLISGILSYLNKDASVVAGVPATSTPTNAENTATPSATPYTQPVSGAPAPSLSSTNSSVSVPVSSVYAGDTALLYSEVPYTVNGSFLFNGKLITDPEITSRYYLNDDDGFKYSIVDYNGVTNTLSVIVPDTTNKGYTVRKDYLYCSYNNCGKKLMNVLYRTFNKENPYVQSAADAQSAAMNTAYSSNTGLISTYEGKGSDGSSTSNENYYYTYSGKNYTMSSINSGVTVISGTVMVDDILNPGYTILLSNVTPVMKKKIGSQYKYINVSKLFSSSVVADSGSGSSPYTAAANVPETGSFYGSGSGSGIFPTSSYSVVGPSLLDLQYVYGSGSESVYGSGSGSGSVYGSGSGSVYGSGSGSVYGSGLVPKLPANKFYQFEANSSTISCSPTRCWWAESNDPNFYLSISSNIKSTSSILSEIYLNSKPSFIFNNAALLNSNSFPTETATITNFTCFFVINIESLPTTSTYNNILSFGDVKSPLTLLQIKLNNSGITSNINSASSASIPVYVSSPFILMVNFYQNKTSSYSQVVVRANGKIRQYMKPTYVTAANPGAGAGVDKQNNLLDQTALAAANVPLSSQTVQFINASSSVNTKVIDIGSFRLDTSSDLKSFSGGISEFLFYDTTDKPFTDSYISQVENYLSTKWNIPIQTSGSGSGSILNIIPDPKITYIPPPLTSSNVTTNATYNSITITITINNTNLAIPITGCFVYYTTLDTTSFSPADYTSAKLSLCSKITIPISNNSTTLTPLDSNKTYHFYIVSYNNAATSSYGYAFTVATSNLPNPTIYSIVSATRKLVNTYYKPIEIKITHQYVTQCDVWFELKQTDLTTSTLQRVFENYYCGKLQKDGKYGYAGRFDVINNVITISKNAGSTSPTAGGICWYSPNDVLNVFLKGYNSVSTIIEKTFSTGSVLYG